MTSPLRGPADPVERLERKLDKSGDCWLWTGTLRKDGYAQISVNRKYMLVHRFSWLVAHGSLPPVGLDLDHLCRVRHCARPDHLEPVTHAENVARGQLMEVTRARILARTHCKSGHPWNDENTAIYGNGKRQCRACRRASYARKVARLRAA